MKHKLLTTILFLLCTLIVLTVPAFAASSTFLPKAQEYINANCNLKKITTQNSLLCYLFEKTTEHDTAIAGLTLRTSTVESNAASQSAAIALVQEDVSMLQDTTITVQNRIDMLEKNTPPVPEDKIFFNGPVSPAGETSEVFDALLYSKATFTYQGTSGSFAIEVSPDETNWFTQYSVGEGQNKSGGTITLNSAGRYYRVSAGGTTLPPNEVYQHALGHFSN